MTTTAPVRPANVFIAMSDGAIGNAIEHIFKDAVQFVDSHEEADLVIFTEVGQVEKGYSRKKSYMFLPVHLDNKHLVMPHNVTTVSVVSIAKIVDVITDVQKKLSPTAPTKIVIDDSTFKILADAKRILVIDDTPKHIASAKKGLAGHRLTTVTSYKDAMFTLGKEDFDVVLIDLHLPMSSKTMGAKFRLGEQVPYGILLMIEAVVQGAKRVAVVTDLSHHDDPFSAAFDHFSNFARSPSRMRRSG